MRFLNDFQRIFIGKNEEESENANASDSSNKSNNKNINRERDRDRDRDRQAGLTSSRFGNFIDVFKLST